MLKSIVNIIIREAKSDDFKQYADLLQRTYQLTYADEEIGLKREFFDEKYWDTKQAVDYLTNHLVNSETRRSWLAFDNNKLIGSIYCELVGENVAWLAGFYVDPDYQGLGIGRKIYKLVLEFVKNRELQLEVYAHATKTIEMYKKWGWKIDKDKGKNGYYDLHWEKWPEGLSARCMYMKLEKNKK